jgi:hypothetical protein
VNKLKAGLEILKGAEREMDVIRGIAVKSLQALSGLRLPS